MKKVIMWAGIVAVILLVPYLAMKFQVRFPDPGGSSEVPAWTMFDFLFAGALLFSAGLVYILATMKMSQRKHRLIVAAAVFIITALFWGAAATGF